MKTISTLAITALLWACASTPPAVAPPAAPSNAATLAYSAPATPSANYAMTDSTVFNIQGGPIGDIKVEGVATARLAVAYEPSGENLGVTIRVTDFTGSFTNSAMGSTPTATEAEIDGPAVVTVSPRGVTTVTTMPKLSSLAQRVGVSQSFFRRMFVRLPNKQVRPGAMWVDTISASDDNAGTKAVLRDIVTSRFVRDTVVAGNRLALITTSSQRTLDISGVNEGVQIAQKLNGTGTGSALWDLERRLLVERAETAQLSGTFELPQMGVAAMPVTARSSLRVSLE